MGKSEQLSYTITIVDTLVCMFFDGMLEEMLERKFSVRHRKTLKTEHSLVEKDMIKRILMTKSNIYICSTNGRNKDLCTFAKRNNQGH